jgi:hypothetical protein
MDELAKAPQNTPQIRATIELGRSQWVFFDNALAAYGKGGDAASDARNVATTSERILEVMDQLTVLYSQAK